MRRYSRPRKIRIIVKPRNDDNAVYGVVLPPSLNHWLNVHVTVFESGDKIILQSGTQPNSLSKEELNKNSEVTDKVNI